MRDYGIVRVRFWDWAKREKLSDPAKVMALYLLTSTHGNSLGCFRLPLAYMCDDLGKGIETVSETVSELEKLGFLERDHESGWTWLPDFLQHNPIPNRNVGKAVEKQIADMPSRIPLFGRMIEGIRQFARDDDKGLSVAFLDQMRERFRNHFDTVSRGPGNQTQTQNQIHEQNQSKTTPDGSADGAGLLRDVEQDVVDLYHSHAEKFPIWPKVRSLTTALRSAIRARLKEHGIGGIREALEAAAASNFITKKGMRGWGLRWLMKPENFAKVIEGYYSRDQQPIGSMGVMARVIDRLQTEEDNQHAADADRG